jgi:hypothetical protein
LGSRINKKKVKRIRKKIEENKKDISMRRVYQNAQEIAED